ncbi:serine/threonine-protein kinase mig-15-like [Convolutriloba macropyga]|uniref:serine/threonine-protein kinase mig-15-like n=1 Tax=Convolutriloba macropyga TaxID=536237 RepID=UPI003F51AED4
MSSMRIPSPVSHVTLPGTTVEPGADPETVFQVLELIGEGTYGEVYKARVRTTGKLVAIKVMENSADLAEEIDTEYSVLAKGNGHPNLPEFYGAFLQSGPGGGGNMSGMPAVTSLSISGAVPKQIWIAIEVLLRVRC